MRSAPDGLDEGDLLDALRDGWGVSVARAQYAPVGGGSYHWRVDDRAGVRHWVSVDDLDDKPFLGDTRDAAFDSLRRAFDTAYALRAGGLDFVVAPVPAGDGRTVLRLGGRHAVTVFPFIAAPAGRFGEHRTAAERVAVVDALVRLHRAPPAAARAAPPEVPHRAGLERALTEVDRPWTGGPYAEPARARLAGCAGRVRGLLDTFDRLAGEVRAAGSPPVLTHGEPHPGNVVFGGDRVSLVDWDTVALAPPERDLWMLDTGEERERYARASGRPVDGAAVRLYRLRWKLDDIASFVHVVRSPHGDDPDTALAWQWSADGLDSEDTWPYAPP
jgi:spectinomycin phosphotransferase